MVRMKHRDELRPETLEDYIGQEHIKDLLWTSMAAAKKRNQPLDHILLNGPPGLGKTTLAMIIAREMGWELKTIIAPSLGSPQAALNLVLGLQPNTALFIDEVHRVRKPVQEVLYPVLEDNVIFSQLSREPKAIPLPPLTVIGATTNLGKLEQPFIDRFGLQFQLNYYSTEELGSIVMASALRLGMHAAAIDYATADEIARRSRGTPRIANSILKRVRDYAEVLAQPITAEYASNVISQKLHIDELGLKSLDRRYLKALLNQTTPLGVELIAAKMNEEADTVQDFIEPYLMGLGFVERRMNGRWLTEAGQKYLTRYDSAGRLKKSDG